MPWTFESTENFEYQGKPWRAWDCVAPTLIELRLMLGRYNRDVSTWEKFDATMAGMKIKAVTVPWTEVPPHIERF